MDIQHTDTHTKAYFRVKNASMKTPIFEFQGLMTQMIFHD